MKKQLKNTEALEKRIKKHKMTQLLVMDSNLSALQG